MKKNYLIKIMVVYSALLINFSISYGQTPASVFWSTKNPDNESPSSVIGNVAGGDVNWGTDVWSEGIPDAVNFNTFGLNSVDWNSEELNEEDYYEFSISPIAGNNLQVSSLQFNANTWHTVKPVFMTIAIYYSLDNFATPGIQIGGNTVLGSSAATYNFNQTPDDFPIAVEEGQILSVRFYGWGASSSDIYFAFSNLTISGSTCTVPVANCQNKTVELDSLGNAGIVVMDIDGGFTAECGIESISVDKTSFGCTDVGDNTVTLTVTDSFGFSSTCSAIVTVQDIITPTVATQNIIVELDANGSASIAASDIDNGSFDNCSIDSMSLDRTAFVCSEVGENTVTLTVVDVNGNSASNMATVTVSDTVSPTVITQDITVELDETGAASITTLNIDNGSFDNCSIDSMSLDRTTFVCSEVGENTVALTVVDVNGNSASNMATVTVKDIISPTLATQNITVELDEMGAASITAADIDNGSFDNCSIDSMSLDRTTFDCSEVGENTVTLTVVDVNGNSASNVATVTVSDTVSPTVITQDITVELDETGAASITTLNIDNGSFDNCSIDSMSLDRIAFDCSEVGANTVTLTVVDVNGNSATKSAIVNVVDKVVPQVVCKDIAVSLELDGTVTVTAEQLDNGSWDACGIQTLELDKTEFDKTDLGMNDVVLTVTDMSGNISSCQAVVTIRDNSAPYVVCNAVDFVLPANGIYELTQADINALARGTTDNGSTYNGLKIEVSPMVLGCSDLGELEMRVYATDKSGNGSFCSVVVNVSSAYADPTIDPVTSVITDEDVPVQVLLSGISDGNVCLDEKISLSASAGNVELVENVSVNYTSGDSEGTLEIELVPDAYGEDVIIVQVEDESGLSTSVSFALTVNPVNDAPVMLQSLANQTVTATQTLDFSLSKMLGVLFDDIDDSSLEYRVTFEDEVLPEWISTTDDSDVFTLTFEPMQADTGCYNVAVEAIDEAGASVSNTFELCVNKLLLGTSDIDRSVFDVRLYPNPTEGEVRVETGSVSVAEIDIVVMNIAGEEVFQKTYSPGSESISFNLSEYVSGMYMVLIKVEENVVIKKLLLKRD